MLKRNAVPYVFLFLIWFQFAMPFVFPVKMVYRNRFDYNLILNNVYNTDAALEQLKKEIKHTSPDNYIILMGSSVLFGTPGPSDKSPGVLIQQYANQLQPGKAPRIINLAIPAAQLGDIYTLLLRLDKLHIAVDHLILDIRYPTFRPHDPYPMSVFWWSEDLRKLEPAAYERVKPQLLEAGLHVPGSTFGYVSDWLKQYLLREIRWMNYKDYVHREIKKGRLLLEGKPIPDDSLGDTESWTRKPKENLGDWLNSDEIKSDYTDKPFDLTENNPDVYFLNKILAHQAGKDTMIVNTGQNHTFLAKYMAKPGYLDNERRVDAMLRSLPVRYINLDGKIPDEQFTDHTHYTPEGYRQLAQLIWDAYR